METIKWKLNLRQMILNQYIPLTAALFLFCSHLHLYVLVSEANIQKITVYEHNEIKYIIPYGLILILFTINMIRWKSKIGKALKNWRIGDTKEIEIPSSRIIKLVTGSFGTYVTTSLGKDWIPPEFELLNKGKLKPEQLNFELEYIENSSSLPLIYIIVALIIFAIYFLPMMVY